MGINWDKVGATQKHYKAEELREKLAKQLYMEDLTLGTVYRWLKAGKFAGAWKPFGARGGWLIPEAAVIEFIRSKGFEVVETTNTGELVARRA